MLDIERWIEKVTYFDSKTTTVYIVPQEQVYIIGHVPSHLEYFHKVILTRGSDPVELYLTALTYWP